MVVKYSVVILVIVTMKNANEVVVGVVVIVIVWMPIVAVAGSCRRLEIAWWLEEARPLRMLEDP